MSIRALAIPLVLVALAGAGVASGVVPIPEFLEAPCARPVEYSIGEIDPRFGVSKAELMSLLTEAESLWNAAAGKTVVTFVEDGDVPVSLVYSEYQRATELGKTISSEQSAYDRKKAEVDQLWATYQAAKATYEKSVAALDRESAIYQKEVAYWNQQGGAPSSEYAELARKRARLESMETKANLEAAKANALGRDVDTAADELNALAGKINGKVNTYNEVAGEDFRQGNYVSDENGKRIVIYEFSDRDELTRVLAHELGHAIGLGHTDNPDSIMYSYDVGKKLVLASEDIALLRETCGLD